MSSNTNASDRARQIVIEVRQRRKLGESISDDDVLRQYPDLHSQLTVQLRQLKQIEQARALADNEHSPVAKGNTQSLGVPEEPHSSKPYDLRMTQQEPQNFDVLRATVLVEDAPTHGMASVGERPNDNEKGSGRTTPFHPVIRPPMAVIKLYHDGGQSFNPYPIMSDRFLIGRQEGDLIIPHDVRMSSRHAEIHRRLESGAYHWYLVDQGSRNGTFVRAGRVALKNDDEIIIGKEYYRFISQNGAIGLANVSGTPGEPWWFDSNTVWLGRDMPTGLSSLTNDEFVDKKHALLQLSSGGVWILKDTGSLNGIWYRVPEVELTRSCAFQLGEQRFGFVCPIMGR